MLSTAPACSAWALPAQPPRHSQIATANLTMHKDGTGTFAFTQAVSMYQRPKKVQFDRIRDVKGAVRVLGRVLPHEVARDAGFVADG